MSKKIPVPWLPEWAGGTIVVADDPAEDAQTPSPVVTENSVRGDVSRRPGKEPVFGAEWGSFLMRCDPSDTSQKVVSRNHPVLLQQGCLLGPLFR